MGNIEDLTVEQLEFRIKLVEEEAYLLKLLLKKKLEMEIERYG